MGSILRIALLTILILAGIGVGLGHGETNIHPRRVIAALARQVRFHCRQQRIAFCEFVDRAQPAIGFGEIGLHLDGGEITFGGFFPPPEITQRVGEIVMGVGIFWISGDGAAIGFDRVFMPV